MDKLFSPGRSSGKYGVSVRRKERFVPKSQWQREFQHALVIAELNQRQATPTAPDFSKMKRELYKRRARTLEAEIVSRLQIVRELHEQELEVLAGVGNQEADVEELENVIAECAAVVRYNKDAEKTLQRMAEEVGGEGAQGSEGKSKWGRFKRAVKRFVGK